MAIYYVDAVGGSDSNSGTNPTTDAWQNFNKIATEYTAGTFSNGDSILVMNTADYAVTGVAAFGTSTSRVLIIGCDASGVVDGSMPRVYASGSMADMISIQQHDTIFAFLNLDGNNNVTNAIGSLTTSYSSGFIYCKIYNSNGFCGIDFNGAGGFISYCEVSGNPIGLYLNQDVFVHACFVHNNTGNGIDGIQEDGAVCNSWIVKNSGIGIDGVRRGVKIENNVIAHNGSHGIVHNFNEGMASISNNIIAYNNGFGVDAVGSHHSLILNNSFWGNSSGPLDGSSWFDLFNETGIQPSFRDSGNYDYDVTSDSSLVVDAYTNWRDRLPGGVERASAAGGGGSIINYRPRLRIEQ